MDDLYALEGGGSATKWQKQHAARQRTKLAKQHRVEARAAKKAALRAAKADLKKRKAKWWAKWKQRAAAAKAAGRPKPSRQGQPHQLGINNPCVVDMTGRSFGRLTVIRSAPVSLTNKTSQSCRVWWVKCSCGSPERMVNGTSLRQGNSRSCGCLKRERLRNYWKNGPGSAKVAARRAELNKELNKPIPWQLLRLRRQFRAGTKEAKLISKTRNLMIAYELRLGIRKPRDCWKTDRYNLEKLMSATLH